MARFRSAVALVLLAALAAGGTVAPLVHGAVHAEETAQSQAHFADGHHHHEAGDDHGPEALPPCPEPLDAHLTCVLCAPASVTVATGPAVLLAPEAKTADWRMGSTRVASPTGLAHGARGPPTLA